MKTEFKQIDELLTFKATALDANEKTLLKELFQMEIPGYEHVFDVKYDGNNSFHIQYVPVITFNNLTKEITTYGRRLEPNLDAYVMTGFSKSLHISKGGNNAVSQHQYKIIDTNTQLVINEGEISNIYELRPLLEDIFTMEQAGIGENLL
ncbi:MAG: hypothetical protein PHW82_00465 [Bacteroidales bacterium]|nr:hypothetical protein [Bacteroidales bacterium]